MASRGQRIVHGEQFRDAAVEFGAHERIHLRQGHQFTGRDVGPQPLGQPVRIGAAELQQDKRADVAENAGENGVGQLVEVLRRKKQGQAEFAVFGENFLQHVDRVQVALIAEENMEPGSMLGSALTREMQVDKVESGDDFHRVRGATGSVDEHDMAFVHDGPRVNRALGLAEDAPQRRVGGERAELVPDGAEVIGDVADFRELARPELLQMGREFGKQCLAKPFVREQMGNAKHGLGRVLQKRQDVVAQVMFRSRPRTRPQFLQRVDEFPGDRLGVRSVVHAKQVEAAWIVGRAERNDVHLVLQARRDVREKPFDGAAVRVKERETRCGFRMLLHLVDHPEHDLQKRGRLAGTGRPGEKRVLGRLVKRNADFPVFKAGEIGPSEPKAVTRRCLRRGENQALGGRHVAKAGLAAVRQMDEGGQFPGRPPHGTGWRAAFERFGEPAFGYAAWHHPPKLPQLSHRGQNRRKVCPGRSGPIGEQADGHLERSLVGCEARSDGLLLYGFPFTQNPYRWLRGRRFAEHPGENLGWREGFRSLAFTGHTGLLQESAAEPAFPERLHPNLKHPTAGRIRADGGQDPV